MSALADTMMGANTGSNLVGNTKIKKMITKINEGLETYVYFNGVLIYKRWKLPNNKSYGRVFHENEGLTQKNYIKNYEYYKSKRKI